MAAPLATPRPPRLRWLGVSRRAVSPAPHHAHDCCASQPGVLPYALLWLLPGFLLLRLGSGGALFGQVLQGPRGHVWMWAWTAAELLLAFVILGWEWRRTPRGAFLAMGSRHVLSLSVAQAVAWTAVVTAATVALLVTSGRVDPLDGPGPLQTGLSLGTAVGSTLLVARKEAREPKAEALRAAGDRLLSDDADAFVRDELAQPAESDAFGGVRQALGQKEASGRQVHQLMTAYSAGLPLDLALRRARLPRSGLDLEQLRERLDAAREEVHQRADRALQGSRHGAVYGNGCACEARFKDLLQGDEVSNATQLDPNKLQFLAFTLLGLFVYGWTTSTSLLRGEGTAAYPAGVLETVGLSGLAYVGLKVPVQTPTQPASSLAASAPAGVLRDGDALRLR